jgi:hypothetical protein
LTHRCFRRRLRSALPWIAGFGFADPTHAKRL